MSAKLNQKAKSHAIALINSGKFNISDDFTPDSARSAGDAEKICLGENDGAFIYPLGLGDMIYRSAVAAAQEQAHGQNDAEISLTAGKLLEKIDHNGKKKDDGSGLNTRTFSIPINKNTGAPETLDEATRSFEIIAATEEPTFIYDWDRGAINEVLIMAGAQLPQNGQMVMLDSHDRYTTGAVIGSMRDIQIKSGQMIGRVYFSSVEEAQSPYIKAREGHLTDFSIGYRVDRKSTVWIPEGQEQIIAGRKFVGPLQVATRWVPREVSIVAIGADANAKARSEINNKQVGNEEEEYKMDQIVRKMLESKGLPTTATDEEAVAFLSKLEGKREAQVTTEPTEEQVNKIRTEAKGEVAARIKAIDEMCGRYEMPEVAREAILGGKTVDETRQIILDKLVAKSKTANPGTSGVEIVADEKDKFRAAANDALVLRAGHKIEKPAPGADDMRGFTLVEIARECLRMSNLPTRGSIKEMVGRALTSSDFPYILANLATKSMQAGWDTAQETWPLWTGRGSVSDFKTYYDMGLSELDDLEEIPDAGEIKRGTFSEKLPETYKIASYGKKFKLTRVMIINDDLGALTQLPAKRTEAANRKIGDIVYAIITANGNMGDSRALFSSTYHSNDAISGYLSAPGTSNIAEAIRAMKSHKDIAGKRRLNIRPEFFIGPVALEGSSEVFFRSEKFADTNTIATDSSLAATRVNPYSGNYFTRIYEPRLDDDSTTAWYLAGPKGKTVKVVFLNGQEGPILEMLQPGFSVEGFEYAVVIDVGAYAQDYRGLYRNEGA